MDQSRPPRVCITTVDPSGDAIAAGLAEALRRRGPVELLGAGGAAMRRAGVELLCETTNWASLGAVGLFSVALRALPHGPGLARAICARQPDIHIPIDSGRLNIPLARFVKRRLGLRVLYYVPPRCWSRRWRVERLAQVADYVAAPFPWNLKGDDGSGRVRFVGHPAMDLSLQLPPQTEVRRELGLIADQLVLAALPGSRSFEIGINVPMLVKTICLLRADLPGLQVVFSRASGAPAKGFERRLEALGGEGVRVVEGTAKALRAADVALVCFGTATLEACAVGCPMIGFYRGTRLMALEYIVHHPPTPYYALPNIVADELVVPEVEHHGVSPERLAQEAGRLLRDAEAREALRGRLGEVAQALGGPGASDRAAEAVLDALSDQWHQAGKTAAPSAAVERAMVGTAAP
jgi:lipid-A-disaccharide synthase